jgi:hypothetical protein
VAPSKAEVTYDATISRKWQEEFSRICYVSSFRLSAAKDHLAMRRIQPSACPDCRCGQPESDQPELDGLDGQRFKHP